MNTNRGRALNKIQEKYIQRIKMQRINEKNSAQITLKETLSNTNIASKEEVTTIRIIQ